jgi:hypothetical protein
VPTGEKIRARNGKEKELHKIKLLLSCFWIQHLKI